MLTFLHCHCVQNTVMNLKLVFLGLWLPVLEASSGLMQWFLESSCRETANMSVRRSWEKPQLVPPVTPFEVPSLCPHCAVPCLCLLPFLLSQSSSVSFLLTWAVAELSVTLLSALPALCVLPMVHSSGDTAHLAPRPVKFLCPSTGPFQKLLLVGNTCPWNTCPCHLEASFNFLRVASPLVEAVHSRCPNATPCVWPPRGHYP